MNGFEGSFLGNGERIGDDAVMECGVCWWVYDPSEGDAIWQIAAGTPFSDLPDHWRCPHCDSAREQFMVLDQGVSHAGDECDGDAGPRHESLRTLLENAYRQADARMQRLPIYRDDLPVGVLGPRSCEAGEVLLAYTPWCMNLILRSPDTERLFEGSERDVALPTGTYPFVRAYLDGAGAIETCSLFSPMEMFEDGAAVEAVAREAFRELFRVEDAAAGDDDNDASREEALEDASRRHFLSGGMRAETQAGAGIP